MTDSLMTDSIEPLNDEQLTELDTLLQANEDFLLVDEAHGFITALVIVDSELLNDDAWLSHILGETDIDHHSRIVELLEQLCGEIEQCLGSGEVFEPLIAEIEEDGEILESYEGWCFGFMLAVSEDEESWSELPQNEQELLMPIAKIALLQQEDEVDMEDEEYDALVELIPGAVGSLYQYFGD